MKRINVFIGNYGSGKSEIAVNAAIKFIKQGFKTTLVDADTVNPYFRSSALRSMLESEGIRVISPVYANTAVDLPTVPPEIYAAFAGDDTVVFDCGGDPAPASVLGSLHDHFQKSIDETAVYYVVNTRRPMQENKTKIIDMLTQITANARLVLSGIVYNANLADETTAADLLSGYPVVLAVSRELNVPIAYISGTQAVLDEFKKQNPDYCGSLFPIRIYMRPEWMNGYMATAVF